MILTTRYCGLHKAGIKTPRETARFVGYGEPSIKTPGTHANASPHSFETNKKGQEMAISGIVTPPVVQPPVTRHRVRVFVDFWNFQLSCRRAKDQFRVDWQRMPQILVAAAGQIVDPNATAHYEGMHVYGSYDKNKPNDVKLKNWFTNSLDKMPGTNVVLLERQKKKGSTPSAHTARWKRLNATLAAVTCAAPRKRA